MSGGARFSEPHWVVLIFLDPWIIRYNEGMNKTILLMSVLVSVWVAPVVAGPPGVRFEPAFTSLHFKRPVFLAHCNDGTGRIVVVEQAGRVLIFDNDPQVTVATEALDMRKRVYSPANGGFNEEGLMGLAFHPQFKSNHQVFLHYSIEKPKRGNVLARFRMNAEHTRIDRASEQKLMFVQQPFVNHNGGMIDFGPDGMLYVALGDGGKGGDPREAGQDLATLLGKILRIDVDRKDSDRAYAIPRDNPFVDVPEARGEIWAYGLRNVWRFSFDRKTGDLWAGDVGQDLWEEIDLITKGGNYGWNIMEASYPFLARQGGIPKQVPNDMIDPIAEHEHVQARSITGGYVYRGRRIPDLNGWYVYGDYHTGLIFTLHYDGQEVEGPHLIGQLGGIASFGEDRDGELYVVSLQGKILKVVAR